MVSTLQERWFWRRRRHSGGREKVFEDEELEALLEQDSCQNQEELARSLGVTQQAISKCLKAMGMIQKQGNWVPYELKPRDVERRLFACEQLLERRKGFLHRIVTGDEKWVHYDNPKRKIMRSSPPCFYVGGQTEYSRLQGHTLYLVGPTRRSVLWTVKTDWNNHRRSVSNAIDAFEPSIERQTAAIQQETR